MRSICSSESTEGNPGQHPRNLRLAIPRLSVLPFIASLLALAWLLAAPNAALAQHGGSGGGHASGGGGGHTSGGHASGGTVAPASHSGSAAPAAHPSGPPSGASVRPSAPTAPSTVSSERPGEIGAGERNEAGERGGAEAAPAPAPHVVYGGYGYFSRENDSAPMEHYAGSKNIWQEPRPVTSVTLAPRTNTTAAAAQPNVQQRHSAVTRNVPKGLSTTPTPGQIPSLNNNSGAFAANNFGFRRRRSFGGGSFGCFNFAFSPCGAFGFGYGYGFGYGAGYGFWGGGYDINPADFNAQDAVAPSPWMGDYLYEGSEDAAEVEAATAPEPLTVIYFKDGSSYGVRDYWMDAGQLHYVASYGGENSVDADRVDLQRTVDENAKNGIDFTLRPAQTGSEKP